MYVLSLRDSVLVVANPMGVPIPTDMRATFHALRHFLNQNTPFQSDAPMLVHLRGWRCPEKKEKNNQNHG